VNLILGLLLLQAGAPHTGPTVLGDAQPCLITNSQKILRTRPIDANAETDWPRITLVVESCDTEIRSAAMRYIAETPEQDAVVTYDQAHEFAKGAAENFVAYYMISKLRDGAPPLPDTPVPGAYQGHWDLSAEMCISAPSREAMLVGAYNIFQKNNDSGYDIIGDITAVNSSGRDIVFSLLTDFRPDEKLPVRLVLSNDGQYMFLETLKNPENGKTVRFYFRCDNQVEAQK